MHVVSSSGKKASIGMYVPFDYGDEEEEAGPNPQNCTDDGDILEFEMDFCKKGHVAFE